VELGGEVVIEYENDEGGDEYEGDGDGGGDGDGDGDGDDWELPPPPEAAPPPMALACIGLQRISKTASIVFTAHRTAGLIRRKRTMRHRPETSGGAKSAASPRLCESSMVRK
jgi:hypothetical protein